MSQGIRVSVSNGKYTFVKPDNGYKIHVLRYGENWVNDLDATNAIFSIMAELDSARVVLQAVRATIDAQQEGLAPVSLIRDALAKHHRLCDDREPPSEWTK